MSLNQEELFEKLIEQLDLKDLTTDNPAFDGAKILAVKVHKVSKIWSFHFEFAKILPYPDFAKFGQSLVVTFRNIAQVEFKISVRDAVYSEELLQNYWPYIVKISDINSPLVANICEQERPYLEEGTVQIRTENELVQQFLQNNTLPTFEQNYQEVGFPKFSIQPIIDLDAAKEKHQAFIEQRAAEEAMMAQQAAEQMQRQQQERQKQEAEGATFSGPFMMGRNIDPSLPVKQMRDVNEEEDRVIFEGYIFDSEIRTTKKGSKILKFKFTDYTNSFTVKKFISNQRSDDFKRVDALHAGMWVKVQGNAAEDDYDHDFVLDAMNIMEITHEERHDTAPEGQKRVELHLHSNMSQMDATNSVGDFVAQAGKWGHKAIAITDHGIAQSYPEAHAAGKKAGVKILYGVEINLVDEGVPITYNPDERDLKESSYVIFDVETTGLSAVYDRVIELAAVKMEKGNVVAQFEEFIDPGHPLSAFTTELTGITTEMVKGSKSEAEVFSAFKEFCAGTVLVAHNATFDMGFLNAAYDRMGYPEAENPVIDTLQFARFLYPEMKRFRLNNLAKKFKVNLEQHHRAVFDSETTGRLLFIFLEDAEKRYQMTKVSDLDQFIGQGNAYQQARPMHATVYATTQAGLKNLFKLISRSLVDYFYRVPRVPRKVLEELREGLIVGTACANGEVFEAIMQKGEEEARRKAKFYDFIEVQPKAVYAPLIEKALIADNTRLEELIKKICQIGEDLNKPVVATGDVHYLNREDKIYREILISSMGGANPLNSARLPDVHFRTTDEMLEAFNFLGESKAQEIVVENSNKIADMCDEIIPVKDKLYTPKIEGAEDEITQLSYDEAHKLYGENLPEIIEARLEKELKSIIGNGFSVIYLISQKLVHKSVKDGYLVGSRGSVGSSLVATMTGITEVNPMPPHYRCPKCKHSEFFTKGEFGSGFDLPDKECPECGTKMKKDGHDIPFETFLGFYGDKVPDIDLNFSGDYQAIAHNYTKVLFGEEFVYRAGTIGTVADKTAFGYVKAYERDHGMMYRRAEIERLAKGATGVKRTTGQHPGGIIVIPDYMDVYDFSPIQYPADDNTSDWRTTHFDFHSIHDNILKLDILGHDDPTVIRMLQDLSGIDPKTIPTDDADVMKIFTAPDILGVTEEQILSKTGTLGIPEFGTRFVRGMLEETNPTTFAELLQISGLSHGTDVWLGNAEELIRNGVVNLAQVIGCRDDIMMYLIHNGMEAGVAFKIMESVRKGKGISDEWQTLMHESEIPQWYIDSCLKIKYMFPKAHATAYILMALRVAYFKVHFPILYYCAFFSVRADDFDLVAMSRGKEAVKARMEEINRQGNDASTKDKNLLTILELANEMIERGFNFKMIDINKSDASNFIIEGDTLIAPFRAVPGLGMNVAKQIVAAREEKEFLSKEDLSKRGKVSKTLIEYMTENGVLNGLPDENQLSLFDF